MVVLDARSDARTPSGPPPYIKTIVDQQVLVSARLAQLTQSQRGDAHPSSIHHCQMPAHVHALEDKPD
jgi:hypothetical protein